MTSSRPALTLIAVDPEPLSKGDNLDSTIQALLPRLPAEMRDRIIVAALAFGLARHSEASVSN